MIWGCEHLFTVMVLSPKHWGCTKLTVKDTIWPLKIFAPHMEKSPPTPQLKFMQAFGVRLK